MIELFVLAAILSSTFFFLDSKVHFFKYEFHLFFKAYTKYQSIVVKKGRSYENFAFEFIRNNQVFELSNNVNEDNKRYGAHILIINLIENEPDLIKEYFSQPKFWYKDYKLLIEEINTTPIIVPELLENITPVVDITPAIVTAPVIVVEPLAVTEIKTPIKNSKEEIDKLIREEILKYESEAKKPKHIGHRIFGFYLREFHPGVTSESERVRIWRKLILLENEPERSYAANPCLNKNNATKKTKASIKIAVEFCNSA